MPKNKGKVSLSTPLSASPSHIQRLRRVEETNYDLRLASELLTGCHKYPIDSSLLTILLQGGKNRRRGKNENDNEKRELTFKEEGQEYAQVIKMLGNGRLEALCFDGEKRLAHIRGKLRKKVWINQGDIILLSLRDYQDEKGDVILKYSADEARSLKAYGELPENAKINETDTYGHEGIEDNVEFDEDRSSDSDKDVDIDDI